ncbi:MAG: hypothetical protein SGJ27_00585 [Candidatus Melainabacteria bacterium]|nr:hypothetical protein [Candidatus Melainabacteria bacterium]
MSPIQSKPEPDDAIVAEVRQRWFDVQMPQVENVENPRIKVWAEDWRNRVLVCREVLNKLAVSGNLRGHVGAIALTAFEAVARAAWACRRIKVNSRRKHADFVIHPKTNGIGVLSTNLKDAVRGIKAREEAAIQALPAIKQKIEAMQSVR